MAGIEGAPDSQAEAASERYAERLLRALAAAGAAAAIGAPASHERLLESVVRTATEVIGARSAALFLVDETAGDLTFAVALGPEGPQVKNLRVPLGHGIAGLVAVSGQAMAVSGAAADPRQARDIADAVGYRPDSLLCVPLVSGDRVTGVLELLDKTGGGSFSPQDMTQLGHFAELAGEAIEQSRSHHDIGALLRVASGEGAGDGREAFIATADADPSLRAARELSDLVCEIAWRGEAEREAALTMLRAFRDYLRSRDAGLL